MSELQSCITPDELCRAILFQLVCCLHFKTGLRRPLCCEAPETFCGRQLSLDFPSTFSVNCSLNKFFSDEMGYPGRGLLFVNLLGKLHLNHSIIEKIKIKYVIHKNHEKLQLVEYLRCGCGSGGRAGHPRNFEAQSRTVATGLASHL